MITAALRVTSLKDLRDAVSYTKITDVNVAAATALVLHRGNKPVDTLGGCPVSLNLVRAIWGRPDSVRHSSIGCLTESGL